MPDPFIYSSDDLPVMSGGLPEGSGVGWWDDFFADGAKPCPFFVEWPDENLVAWFGEAIRWARERAKQAGAAVEFQCCSIFDAGVRAGEPGRRPGLLRRTPARHAGHVALLPARAPAWVLLATRESPA